MLGRRSVRWGASNGHHLGIWQRVGLSSSVYLLSCPSNGASVREVGGGGGLDFHFEAWLSFFRSLF